MKLTEAEKARFGARAAEHGISIQRLLVEAALVEDGPGTPSEARAVLVELMGLHRTVAGIGRNMNQIATAANTAVKVLEAGSVDERIRDDLRRWLLAFPNNRERLGSALDAIDEACDRWAQR